MVICTVVELCNNGSMLCIILNVSYALSSVGGIYTVIRTKAAVTVEELGDRYFLIGPYNESCVRTELDIMEPPNEAVARAFHQMRDHGLKVYIHIETMASKYIHTHKS